MSGVDKQVNENARTMFCEGCPCKNFDICEMRKVPGWLGAFKQMQEKKNEPAK